MMYVRKDKFIPADRSLSQICYYRNINHLSAFLGFTFIEKHVSDFHQQLIKFNPNHNIFNLPSIQMKNQFHQTSINQTQPEGT